MKCTICDLTGKLVGGCLLSCMSNDYYRYYRGTVELARFLFL